VARDIIRGAIGNVFAGYFANADLRQVTEWFDLGGNLQIDDTLAADELMSRARDVQGLCELAFESGIDRKAPPPVIASAIDFVLEGLYAQKKISRSDEFQYQSAEPPRRPSPRGVQTEASFEREIPNLGGKKKYYN
jgi:magnesium chelatase subunit I